MGFATVHKTYNKEESSPCFVEVINELTYFRDPNYIFAGSVNSGEDESRKRNLRAPVTTTLSYRGDLQTLNKYHRKQKFQKVKSNLSEWTWPTTAVIYDEQNNLVGMIGIPEGSWSSLRSDFFKNLNFFLHPFERNYPKPNGDYLTSFVSPNREIVVIDDAIFQKQYAYELKNTASELQNAA